MRFGWGCLSFGMAVDCFWGRGSVPRGAACGVAHVSTASQPYRLGLTSVVNPPSGAMGLILKARVNGGPVLRLLVDSGAQYLVLDRKAARKSGQLSGAELDLVGAGASP